MFDTIDRGFWSYWFCYLVPQPILKILPPDAHAWELFITPEEVKKGLEEVGLRLGKVQDMKGLRPTLRVPEVRKWGTKWAWLGDWKQTSITHGSYLWYAWKPS